MLLITKTEAPRENQPEEIDYQVIHTTVGRCRIRVPRLASDSEYASKLNWLVDSLDFVISVRINPAASSLIVNYDTCVFSSTAVQENLVTAIQQASTTELTLAACRRKV